MAGRGLGVARRKMNDSAGRTCNVMAVNSYLLVHDAYMGTTEYFFTQQTFDNTSYFIHLRLGDQVFDSTKQFADYSQMRVKGGEYGAAPEFKGRGSGRSPRKPADQRHRPARFPHAKIRVRPHWESNPAGLGGSHGSVVVILLTSHHGEPSSIPGGVTPGFIACGNCIGRCRWSASFLGDLPFRPLFRSAATPYLPRFTLIGSQDLDVKSHPNLFTDSLPCSSAFKRLFPREATILRGFMRCWLLASSYHFRSPPRRSVVKHQPKMVWKRIAKVISINLRTRGNVCRHFLPEKVTQVRRYDREVGQGKEEAIACTKRPPQHSPGVISLGVSVVNGFAHLLGEAQRSRRRMLGVTRGAETYQVWRITLLLDSAGCQL
ncbi:hypothetical protein PR048_013769 [Dryococelus australis]|uniref:Uncharacterized protein n=1 Tax=Dryococelus australis TaxID=614101 RepID=A0ABQ9HT39_9NEOP|nr:hypothetical protein PR048_013769 [Dryococelus australis]